MPKKKKGRGKGKRRGKAKAKRSVRHKKPIALGTSVGAIDAAYSLFMKPAPAHKQQVAPLGPSPVDFLIQKHIAGYGDSIPAKLGDAFTALKDNARNLNSYKGLAAGFLVSQSKKIPIIEIVAKPLDRGIKRFTKGRLGL
jgi:hypothetical protein